MSAIDSSALATLRATLSASAAAHLPSDPGYSVERWALNCEKQAALVVCPATVDDVLQALSFAEGRAPFQSQKPLSFTVKGGGFSASGASSCDGGLVIDLQPKMCDVRVDPTAKLVYVGGGCIWEQVDEAVAKHGLAAVSAAINQVGVGGSTLDGGTGWLVGQHGLMIDNLAQAKIVTVSGETLTASDSENTDLFWALRGGGGNFVIVTEFVFKLHEQRADLYTSVLVFPPPKLELVVTEINAWLAERTSEENAMCIFTLGKTVKMPVFVLHLVYNGDSAEGAKRFERFVKLGPVVNQTETISYARLNTAQNEHTASRGFGHVRGTYIPKTANGIPVAFATGVFSLWSRFIGRYPTAEPSKVIFELYHSDKWSSVTSDATAFVNRRPRFNVFETIRWTDPSFTAQAADATNELARAITKLSKEQFAQDASLTEGYPEDTNDPNNYAASQELMPQRFGSNYARLVDVKRKYDPKGLIGKGLVA